MGLIKNGVAIQYYESMIYSLLDPLNFIVPVCRPMIRSLEYDVLHELSRFDFAEVHHEPGFQVFDGSGQEAGQA